MAPNINFVRDTCILDKLLGTASNLAGEEAPVRAARPRLPFGILSGISRAARFASQTSNLAAGSPYKSRKNASFLPSCRLFGDRFSSQGGKREGRKCFYYFPALIWQQGALTRVEITLPSFSPADSLGTGRLWEMRHTVSLRL